MSEQPCTAETVDRAVSTAEVEQVAATLRPRLGVPLGPLVRASVCMWTNTPDHHFVLAPHPVHPEVVVAAGCSGHAVDTGVFVSAADTDEPHHGDCAEILAFTLFL